MKKLIETLKSLIPLAVVAGIVAGVVVLAMNIFSGGGDEGGGNAALALGPAESSWVSGQESLTANPQYAAISSRAVQQAQARAAKRKHALEALEARKQAAKERADAEAKRRYLEAKRRAERLYKEALRQAAIARAKEEARLAELRRKRAAALARREAKLRVKPGPECRLPEVRKLYDCRTGRLPDTAQPPKKKNKK